MKDEHFSLELQSAEGRPPEEARWFSVTVTKDQVPEMFKQGDGEKTIAAWELLGTVIANAVFTRGESGERRSVAVARGITDNQKSQFTIQHPCRKEGAHLKSEIEQIEHPKAKSKFKHRT